MSAPAPVPKKRILIAEDDAAIAVMLTRILRQDYEVVHVVDGPSALARASAQPHPDLLLLDIMMPGLDGLDVARRVRLHPALKKVPIIFLTAKGAPTDVIKGIQHGARSYITKPFKLDEVLSKVKKALSG
ncbi:MAG TPA: response regulator [Polyangiaceae bacterium]